VDERHSHAEQKFSVEASAVPGINITMKSLGHLTRTNGHQLTGAHACFAADRFACQTLGQIMHPTVFDRRAVLQNSVQALGGQAEELIWKVAYGFTPGLIFAAHQ
jgi:hypothetical protein